MGLRSLPLFVLHRGFNTYPKPVAAPAAEIFLWMVKLPLRYPMKWGLMREPLLSAWFAGGR